MYRQGHKRHEDKEEQAKTYCAVDNTKCDGICAELHRADCSELMAPPRKKRKEKKKFKRRPSQDDDE